MDIRIKIEISLLIQVPDLSGYQLAMQLASIRKILDPQAVVRFDSVKNRNLSILPCNVARCDIYIYAENFPVNVPFCTIGHHP